MLPSIISLAQPAELLGGSAFSAQEFAQACGVTWDWVLAGVTLVRARRIAQLERIYGADPQLAALTTDLIDEVVRLRQRLGIDGELRVRGAPMPAVP